MSYLKLDKQKGNEGIIRCLMQTGIKSIRDRLDDIDEISGLDLMLIGHNLHRYMIDVALESMYNKDNLSDNMKQRKEKDFTAMWVSAIDTLLEETVGIDYYVNYIISQRTDEYIEELMNPKDE